jgi:hypothetical protein
VISFCMFFGRNTQRFTRWPTSTVDLQELHHSKGHDQPSWLRWQFQCAGLG